MTEKELVAKFAELVKQIIIERQSLDDFLDSGENSTFRGDVVVEQEDKIAQLTKEADLILVLLDDIAEANPSLLARLKSIMKDLLE